MTDTVLYSTKYAKKENYLKIEIYKMYRFFVVVSVLAGHAKCSLYN